MKTYGIRLKFRWNLFLQVHLTIQSLVQLMAWRQPGDKPLSEPIESTRTMSMEDVSTWVLEKIKNIYEVKIKPKNYMMYQDIYNCICQNTIKMNVCYPLWIYYPMMDSILTHIYVTWPQCVKWCGTIDCSYHSWKIIASLSHVII